MTKALIFNRSDALVQGTHFSAAPITGGGSIVQAGSGTTTSERGEYLLRLNHREQRRVVHHAGFSRRRECFGCRHAKFGVSASSVTNSATIGNLTLGNVGATTLDFSYGFGGNPDQRRTRSQRGHHQRHLRHSRWRRFVVGTFPVLKYSSLSGSFASTVVGPRGVTASVSNDTVNQVIYVNISSVGSWIVWTGTNSVSPNLWDLNTTTNWLIGGLPTVYIESVPPGDAVAFNDRAAARCC